MAGMDAATHFQGKKITVMGLGLLGRGVGDAKYLAEAGADLIVTDLKSKEALAASVAQLEGYPNVTLRLGEHKLEDFRNRDIILKAAGVPLESVYIDEAKKTGARIEMSASLFAQVAGIPVIGVTGTRGKSTVTYMLEAILRKAERNVLLGGNIRGVSNLALLEQVTGEEVALMELDSWQLQGFGEAKRSPELAIFTTFYPDHMTYYHDDLDRYLEDKAQIFLYQKEEDTLVLGSQMAAGLIETYAEGIRGRVVVAGDETLPKDWELVVPGEHNRYNAGIALAAARAYGIADEVSKEALTSFLGAPGRLELIALKQGVAYYNDTNSTTPQATIAALHALGFDGDRRICLIMGGHDKNLDMNDLLALIPETTKHISLLSGTGTDRIRAKLPGVGVFGTLSAALEDAHAHAESGDIILLSPAFSSFGMFKNEYDRGDQFNALVGTV